ncbi:MAG: hypothetical protein PHP17_03595 [Candidatus Omnitrophica bacterium]|nr:hypothetical protein [Candidatus Omnitrophota bacterium]
MKKLNIPRLFFLAAVSVSTLSFLFVSFTIYAHLKYKRSIIQQAKSIVQLETDRVVKEISSQLTFTQIP